MKKGIKYVYSILIISSVVLFVSCSGYVTPSFEDPGPNPTFNYKFDYTPTVDKKLSEPLTMLLISPSYQITYPQGSSSNVFYQTGQNYAFGYNTDAITSFESITSKYTNAMGEDFKEMMTSRDFRIIEMVKNKESATFSQREQSNFCLIGKVTLEISDQVTSSSEPAKNIGAVLLTNVYSPGSQNGVFGVKSRITLEVYEPLTWQLIWTKSLETEPLQENYQFKWNYMSVNSYSYKVGSDSRAVSLASLLEKSYKNVMDNLMTYIDPDEFTLLSKQAKEIRKQATGIVK